MKALTIRQPWAALITSNIKTIETRTWTTKYRGPLAIHAGKRRMNLDCLPVLMDSGFSAVNALMMYSRREDITRALYGAVVATCTLYDVVPIVSWDDIGHGHYKYIKYGMTDGDLWLYNNDSGRCMDVTAQKPFGDFTPGNFAWLLTDIKPVKDQISVNGKQGLWNFEDTKTLVEQGV